MGISPNLARRAHRVAPVGRSQINLLQNCLGQNDLIYPIQSLHWADPRLICFKINPEKAFPCAFLKMLFLEHDHGVVIGLAKLSMIVFDFTKCFLPFSVLQEKIRIR